LPPRAGLSAACFENQGAPPFVIRAGGAAPQEYAVWACVC